MKKSLYSITFGILLMVFVTYSQNHKILSPKERVSGAQTYIYDKSVKTEIGKPIMVSHVVDGDTVVLINGEHLRYVGIDTPEEFDPRKPVQCFAVDAAAKNKELVEGKTIKFQKDVNTLDKYGRWLGYVYLEDGTFVNMELVKQGYAFSYPYVPDISKSEEFAAAEKYARENNLGLWAGCSVNILSTGREQTNPVQ